jgi:hypothetical protein
MQGQTIYNVTNDKDTQRQASQDNTIDTNKDILCLGQRYNKIKMSTDRFKINVLRTMSSKDCWIWVRFRVRIRVRVKVGVRVRVRVKVR